MLITNHQIIITYLSFLLFFVSMSKEEIINDLANNGDLKQVCRNIAGGNSLYHDLYQELILALCEKPAEVIEGLYDRGELRFYSIGVASRLYKGNRTSYSKKYKEFRDRVTYTDDISEMDLNKFLHIYIDEYDESIDEKYKKVTELLEKMRVTDKGWYDYNMLKYTLLYGSMFKVHQATGIDYKSVQYSMRKLKTKIRKAINND